MRSTVMEQAALLRRVAARTFVGALRGRRPPGEVVRQMYQVGNRSVLFIAVTLGFIGMVLVFQTCLQINRITGDLSQVGGEFVKILIHEFGPSLTAMMLATRVGAGIAAEVGSMTVTEQIDALRMCGADPIDYLVTPRVLAGLLAMLTLGVIGAAFMFGVGGFVAHVTFKVPWAQFFSFKLVRFLDLASFLNKCAVFGFVVPLVGARAGFQARGGSEGVGSATTRAVIECSLWILLFDLLIGAFYFFLA